MKKLVSAFLCIVMFFSILPVSVFAEESKEILLSQTTEVLDNGDFVVTELYQSAIQSYASTKAGHKTSTYYTASGKAMWAVTVNATFTYTYGALCHATSAESIVSIYDSGVSFISKNAYMLGATATAVCSVQYGHSVSNGSVSITCDIYGNLS